MSGLINRPEDWDRPVELPTIPCPKKVLVPFDGSHNAERALAWSALVGKGSPAEVVVVVAFDPPLTMKGRGALHVEDTKTALEEEARLLAEESVQALLERNVQARGVVVRGDIVRAILETVDTEDADLIVMGRVGVTHEMGGLLDRFRSFLEGSVAEKVSRHATVPVLLVA